MLNKDKILKIVEDCKIILGERNYKRILYLINIENNWDGQNADSINFESLEKALIFLKSKRVIANDLCIFFDYEGSVILEWNIGDINNTLTFKDNGTFYYNNNIVYDIPLLDYHLTKLSFESVLNIFSDSQLEKLNLIDNIEKSITKRTLNSLINIALSENYFCKYSPEYEVDFDSFKLVIDFLKIIEIKDIYFWVVADGYVEAEWKKDNLESEFDFKKDIVSVYKYPLSDENIRDFKIEDLKKYKEIKDILNDIF